MVQTNDGLTGTGLGDENATATMEITIKDIAKTAWDELQLVSTSATPSDIIAAFRELSLSYAIGRKANVAKGREEYQAKAVAYRFIQSIPMMHRWYLAKDAMPLLKPLDFNFDPEINRNLRAFGMLDASIACMERAQRPWEWPYVNYVIHVHYCYLKHVVRRRYTEFERLHQVLSLKMPVLPEFPEKNWMYKLVAPSERAKRLSLYLNRLISLLSHRGVFSIDIMAFLEIDHSRIRAREEGLAAQILNKSSTSGIQYVIASEWLNTWKTFVLGKGPPPGPINNSSLLEPNGLPKSNLYPARDYRFINQEGVLVWHYFALVYSGGPEISRETASIYGSRAFDHIGGAILIQKIIRGFLARQRARHRRDYVKTSTPEVEQQVLTLHEITAAEERFAKIRAMIASQESFALEKAAKKIQRILRLAHTKKTDEVTPASPTFEMTAKEASISTSSSSSLHSVSGHPLESALTLKEIGTMEDETLLIARFIEAMLSHGFTIDQSSMASGFKPTPATFRVSDDGAHLLWWSSNNQKAKALALADVEKIEQETMSTTRTPQSPRSPTSPGPLSSLRNRLASFSKKRVWEPTEHVLQLHSSQGLLQLHFQDAPSCRSFYVGLNALLTEVKSRVESSGYMDSYGALRKKAPHAKKLIRQATEFLRTSEQVTKAFQRTATVPVPLDAKV